MEELDRRISDIGRQEIERARAEGQELDIRSMTRPTQHELGPK